MRDGVLAGIALAAARAQAQIRFEALVAQYPQRTWGHPPVSDIFPPSYPAINQESSSATSRTPASIRSAAIDENAMRKNRQGGA
ncbi:hypothetical protein BH23PSE1_BH23PSE1_00720 [soil metagenome]